MKFYNISLFTMRSTHWLIKNVTEEFVSKPVE